MPVSIDARIDHTPARVPADQVTTVDLRTVPASVRKYAWARLSRVHGPAERWYTIARMTRQGQRRTVVARWVYNRSLNVGVMEYGVYTPAVLVGTL